MTMNVTQKDWYHLDNIIAAIYTADAATVLQQVCKSLKSVIDFDKSFTNLSSNQNNLNRYFHYESLDIDERTLDSYIQYYVDIDYCAWYTVQPHPSVYRDTDLINEQKKEQATFFKEWMLPMNVYYGCGLSAAANEVSYGELTLFRSKGKGDFTDRDLEILEILNRHLCQFFSGKYPGGISKSSFDKQMTDFQVKYNLTAKENEIIENIKRGVEIKELHKVLFVSENTIKKHLANIYTKLNIKNRSQLIKAIFHQE